MKKKPNLLAWMFLVLVTVAFAWAGVQAGLTIGQYAVANGNEAIAMAMGFVGVFGVVGILIALLAGRFKRG